ADVLFSSRRRHTRCLSDWSSDVCSSDLFDDQPMGTAARVFEYARFFTDAAAASSKPFYFMTMRSGIFRRDLVASLRERGIALIGGVRAGLGAVDRLARWSAPLAEPRPASRGGDALRVDRARPTIHEHDAKRLLAQAGLPIVREQLVMTLDNARAAAKAMIEETRAATLLAGHRGRPPGDVVALARCLEALADFAWAERAALKELDVNPIVVRESGAGCVVVDALIVPL